MSPHRRLVLLAAALAAAACQPEPAAPVAVPAAVAPQPVARILADAQRDLDAMQAIYDSGMRSGSVLGQLNGTLQSRAYFRRVPTAPALESLESGVRALAVQKLLLVVGFSAVPDPPPPQVPQVRLAAGQRWQPTPEHLTGTVQVRIDLQGAPRDAAGFIQALPGGLERLLIITGSEAIPGGVRLLGQAFFERELLPPEIEVHWPTLEDRLRAAGHDPAHPALELDPAYLALQQAVVQGRQRLPDVRHALKITADFPRWLLRARLFEERSLAAMAVRGEMLLGTVAP